MHRLFARILIGVLLPLLMLSTGFAGDDDPGNCNIYLKRMARKSVDKGLAKKGDQALDCCRLSAGETLPVEDLGLESLATEESVAAAVAGSSNPEAVTVDPETLSRSDQLELARRYVNHGLTISYGADPSSWVEYSPMPDPLDRSMRVINHLFFGSPDTRIPKRIAELLAQEVKTNLNDLRKAREAIAADARPLAEKYISLAFAGYSSDVVEMFQNSRGSQAEFFAPLVNRVQGCRLDFKQVLEDSIALTQVQSDLFIASQPLREIPELAANPRYRRFREMLDVAFFRRYADVLSPHDSSVYVTLEALASGVDPSTADPLPKLPEELREQLSQINDRLKEAQENLLDSRRKYALGYRTAAMDLALLNRLGKPRGDNYVESSNILRLLDTDPRLTSGELYSGLYKAALDLIAQQGFFKDQYLDFSIQNISRDQLETVLKTSASIAGPRIFSVITTNTRMEHEFNLGEMAALNEERDSLRRGQQLEKQTKWTDALVWGAGLATKFGKKLFPGGSIVPDDIVTKALNSQRQALVSHGFQEAVPVHPEAIPANMRQFLASVRTDRYTPDDLSVEKLKAYLLKELGPLPGYSGPPPPERLSLAEDFATGVMQAAQAQDAAPAPEGAEQAVQPLLTAEPSSFDRVTPPPVAADAGVDGTIALQHALSILSRRAEVLRRLDLELGIRELVYRVTYATNATQLQQELRKVNTIRGLWEREHRDLQDRVEEVTQAVIDAFRLAKIDKSVALATLADELPTGLRHFIINVGGRVREKLVPLYARVLIQIITDLNPLQLLDSDQLKNIAADAGAPADVKRNLTVQKRAGWLAAAVIAGVLGGGIVYHEVLDPYLATHFPAVHAALTHSAPAPAAPPPVSK